MVVVLVDSGKKFPGLTCQELDAVILGEAWQVVFRPLGVLVSRAV